MKTTRRYDNIAVTMIMKAFRQSILYIRKHNNTYFKKKQTYFCTIPTIFYSVFSKQRAAESFPIRQQSDKQSIFSKFLDFILFKIFILSIKIRPAFVFLKKNITVFYVSCSLNGQKVIFRLNQGIYSAFFKLR